MTRDGRIPATYEAVYGLAWAPEGRDETSRGPTNGSRILASGASHKVS